MVSKRQQQQQTCPHREAAISMLPQADPTDGMSCDSCNKDIKFVSMCGVSRTYRVRGYAGEYWRVKPGALCDCCLGSKRASFNTK